MIKSPIYRNGNKEKEIDKILKILPNKIENFYDVFGGSGVVVINTKAKNKHYNELDAKTFKMVKFIKESNKEELVKECERYYKKYENQKEKYYQLTKYLYNKTFKVKYLWLCSFSTFSNNVRFNKNGELNIPFGKRMSIEKIYNINNFNNLQIYNEDFRDFIKKIDVKKDDFLFFDPPYLNSAKDTNKSMYNNEWNEEDEDKLLKILTELNEKEIKWILTNTMSNKGIINEKLKDFINKNDFNIEILNGNNQANGKDNNDYQEIAIFNYQPQTEQLELF
jgi:DNA adenine methylase Dam